MNNYDLEQIEKKFAELKKKANEKQWNDPYYFRDLAFKYEKENVGLSFRLMQRAHNLKPDGPIINEKLESYRQQLPKQLVLGQEMVEENPVEQTEKLDFYPTNISTIFDSIKRLLSKHSFFVFVFFPSLLYFLYGSIWETERYESRSKIVVKQPDTTSTLVPELALLGGVSSGANSQDAFLLKEYILSYDMLKYLDSSLNVKSHYTNGNIDVFTSLSKEAMSEEFLEYYQSMVKIEVDSTSGVVSIYVKAFDADFAKQMSRLILQMAEEFINSISQQLAKSKLEFVNKEHELASSKLNRAQNSLLEYQQKHELLDPESEGAAMQSITFKLESEIAAKRAELNAYNKFMSRNSPEVIQAENVLQGLEQQLNDERKRLAVENGSAPSVSSKLITYSQLKIEVELALQSYSATLVSLESARVEALQQIKYLVKIENSTLPESTSYPKSGYNTVLFAVILLLLYGTGRIIVATILELK